jgi:hypothetical protein
MTDKQMQEPIEFGMNGEKMMFKVGVQQFTLDYEPDTQDEFNFMRDMLVHALSTFTPDVNSTPPAQPAVQGPTVEDNSQDWAGMDGATAWHLIDRHADGWADVAKMMGEWLAANAPPAGRLPDHVGYFYFDEEKWKQASDPISFSSCTKLYTAAQPAPVPKGWKMVPVEPTREMWTAVNKLDDQCAAGNYDGKGCSIEQAWNCLLDAAPTPPAAYRQWTGLTNDVVNNIAAGCHLGNSVQDAIFRAAAKLKERNV